MVAYDRKMRNAERTENTRSLLLRAAREEFAAHGIAGARVDRIAERAGVNKQRIYAYFGDKEQLFRHVVGAALDELSCIVTLTDDTDPGDYVARVFDYHREHPELLRLFLWEALHYGETPLPGEEERARLYDTKTASLSQALGGRVPEPEVRLILLTLIGMAAWPQITPQLARLVLGADGSGPDPEPLREHLVRFARAALPTPREG